MYIEGAYCAWRVPIRSSARGSRSGSLEEHLPGEQGPVQLAFAEHPPVHDH
jgi:hypothetical protein